MKLPDAYVGKRFFVGEGKPEILGRGPTEVRGSYTLRDQRLLVTLISLHS